ncbi:unnamed protein product [Clonostachys rosea]|uniref:Uncharacterized protein n=1 Tax=Bionectria ochroleuca TaxID=29856 RepID=A0ABY6TZL4_BIOOC|nr:unnamed protein product [Clonostachys rosea]
MRQESGMLALRERVLDVEDVLVSDVRSILYSNRLDVERCVRLHNYLAARAWMAKRQKGPGDLHELFHRPSYLEYFERGNNGNKGGNIRALLHPDVVLFLESIIFLGIHEEDDPYLFLWVSGIEIPSFLAEASKTFLDDQLEIDGKPRFITLYSTIAGVGHGIGVVYDQLRHQVSFPYTGNSLEFVSPVVEHEEMWFPLEVLLSNWINLIHLGKIIPQAQPSRPSAAQGVWNWKSYSPLQVDSAVAAFARLTEAIESRMPAGSLLTPERESPLLTVAQLDAACVPENCFIRSFLTKVETPRFSTIAPGLEVTHDAMLFAKQQTFTKIASGSSDENSKSTIPPILLFAATEKSRKARLGDDSTSRFLELLQHNVHPPKTSSRISISNFVNWFSLNPVREYTVPAGLYTEAVDRDCIGSAEEGFRLLLPYPMRLDYTWTGPRMSDGSLVEAGSSSELFQHGHFFPFGGDHRAQRLERLLDRWRELVEQGIWKVGSTGVEGSIDMFRDAEGSGWRHYWIPPDW